MPQIASAGSEVSRGCFGFPAVAGKKVTAAFDGGRLTSDGGVLLLGQAERQMGIAARLDACINPKTPRDTTMKKRHGCPCPDHAADDAVIPTSPVPSPS